MASIKEKRKEFMDYLTKVMDLLDPSGTNSQIYLEKYSKMSDTEFDKAVREFLNDDEQNLYLEIVEFERDLKLEDIEKCAEFMNVPLYERVAMPYITGDMNNVVVTPEPVPVGYLHEKRMQQTILKKNTGSTSIVKRNPKTGQVTSDDKNARNSDVETYSLIATGALNGLAELQGPRADDMVMKNEMYSKIAKDGYVNLKDLTNDPENKVALNTLDAYFLMMGISTNLVTPLNVLPRPRERK